MPIFCFRDKRNKLHGGFTMIELLVVFAIMAVLSILSIASFSSYNTIQKLTTTMLDVKTSLQYAKSQTASQVNICASGQQFVGYKVLLCCQGGSCPTCLSQNDYEVDIVCSGGSSFVSGKKLPQGITIDKTNATSFSVLFSPLSGAVTGAGTFVLKQGAVSKNIGINALGVIQ